MNIADLKVPHKRARALIIVTSQFLLELDTLLYSAEFELAMRKNASEQGDCGHVNYLHDYCDANQCMLNALAQVFPGHEFDPTDEEVGALIDEVYALATKWCCEVWR